MSETPSIATQVLKKWGASVTPIKTSSKSECDLLVELEESRILVEEKIKLDSNEYLREREAVLSDGQVHGIVTSLAYNNRISGIVRKGRKQVTSTGLAVEHDFKILWFTGIGPRAEAKHLQFIATLYGSTRVWELDEPTMRGCYFFRHSEFFRHKDLDGAVASYLVGETLTFKLCLNPYSSAWQALRESMFAKQFRNGLIDPLAEESAGDAYIADGDFPRDDAHAAIAFLESKYGLRRAQHMDMMLATGAIRVPTSLLPASEESDDEHD